MIINNKSPPPPPLLPSHPHPHPHPHSILLQEREPAGAPGDACTSGTAWYVCKSNDFTGCCSVDPCDLSTCPDNSNTGINGGTATAAATTSSATSKTPVQITVLPSTSSDDDGGGAASSTTITVEGSTLINTKSTTTVTKPQSTITSTSTQRPASATSTKDLPLSTSATSNTATTATKSSGPISSAALASSSSPTTSSSSQSTPSSSSSSSNHKTAIIASTVSIGSIIFLLLLLLFYLRRRRANQQKKWLNESRGTISPYQNDHHGHGGINGDGVGDLYTEVNGDRDRDRDRVRDEEVKELDTPTDTTTNSGSFQSRTTTGGVEVGNGVPNPGVTDGEGGIPVSFWGRLKGSGRRGNVGSAFGSASGGDGRIGGSDEMNEKSINGINQPSCLTPGYATRNTLFQTSNPSHQIRSQNGRNENERNENERKNYSPDPIPNLDSTPIIPQNELEAFPSSLPQTYPHQTTTTTTPKETSQQQQKPTATAELSASLPSSSPSNSSSSLTTTNQEHHRNPSPKTPTPSKKPNSNTPSPSPSPPRSQNTFGSPRHEKKKSSSKNDKIVRNETGQNGKEEMKRKENGMMRSNLNGYGYRYQNGKGGGFGDRKGEDVGDVGEDVTSWQEFDPKPRSCEWGIPARSLEDGKNGMNDGVNGSVGGRGNGGDMRKGGDGICTVGQQVSPMITGEERWSGSGSGRLEVSPQTSPEIGR